MKTEHMTIEEMLVKALDGIDELNTRVRIMEIHHPAPQTVDVKDIAIIEGVSFAHLNSKARYLLPRYGISAYPDGHRRWPLEEFLDWRKKPIEERVRGYEKYLESIRLNCIAEREKRA